MKSAAARRRPAPTAAVLFDAGGAAIGWQQGRVLGVYAHGLFEVASRDAARCLAPPCRRCSTPSTLLADMVQQHLDPALLRELLGG
jgi:adenosylcobyric acid synthase